MDNRDPPPFGYTFSNDFFDTTPTPFDNPGPALLNDLESQSLADFFTHTNHWPTEPAHSDPPSLAPGADPKDTHDDASNWAAFPPPTIHSVSTTIPDPALLPNFHHDDGFASHFANTADDIQAASTLYTNAHMSLGNGGRAYSFPNLSSPGATMPSASSANGHNGHGPPGFHAMPTVPTPHGHINEQLAALLPNHETPGTIDAQLVAQFANSDAQQHHEAELQELGLQRPPLKRSYTYGTDGNFSESGFQPSSKHETEAYVTKRMMRDLHHAQSLARQTPAGGNGTHLLSPTGHIHFPGLVAIPSDEERQSDEASSDDDDDDRPAKKRRKSKASPTKNERTHSGSRGSGKNRKASVDDRASKKKRGSVAGQKHRENLTEEQKRNNHIISEQKRRNLIKRGFDDLHELVPEIRNGGLSKSSILMEAANFLEKLIEDNKKYLDLLGAAKG